jgi:hypothetical protein
MPEYQIVILQPERRVMARTFHGTTAAEVAYGLSQLPQYRDVVIVVEHDDGTGVRTIALRVMNGNVRPRE